MLPLSVIRFNNLLLVVRVLSLLDTCSVEDAVEETLWTVLVYKIVFNGQINGNTEKKINPTYPQNVSNVFQSTLRVDHCTVLHYEFHWWLLLLVAVPWGWKLSVFFRFIVIIVVIVCPVSVRRAVFPPLRSSESNSCFRESMSDTNL